MEKCHIQLLRCNELWKLASGLPDHDAVVIDEAGRQLASLHITHTPEGLHQLTSFLQDLTGPDAKEQMACIVETTHG